jgi:hypothetical protein
MTAYGPPGPPGPSQPPPGASAHAGPRPDPKSVNPLDWGILGAALLALVFSCFAYYSYAAKGPATTQCKDLSSIPSQYRGTLQDLCDGDSASAWHGFFGWFGVLLAVVGALLVAIAIFAPHVNLPFPARLGALGAFVLGIISTLLALAVIPSWPGAATLGIADNEYDQGIDDGHGFSYWIVLILIIVGAALCFLRFQQTGGQLPGRPGAGGPPPGAVPPPGYGPPPTQQGPPPGYPQQGPPPAQ